MSRVHKLSPDIANRIAAGEVIERPANAVKELVENAIDAGARRIDSEIEDGGKTLILVRDDGSGMSGEDAILSLQRHATSKLTNPEDLFEIRTLGFRGEALPSVAAVSRFEMTTRESSSEAATRITVEGGVVLDVSEVAAPVGTEISVQGLFYNTPARFKFLKSDAAEAGRISELIGHLALAYPAVSFRLRHNNHDLLRAEAIGEGNPLNAVVSVLGRDIARQMLPIAEGKDQPSTENANEMRVSGFIGRPQLTRSNRNLQLFFVNGRVIKNRSMQHAVQAAYEGLVHGRDRFPVAIVFLQMPPNSVDVNVHPAKSEVRFAREWEVHHAVRVALRETLVASQLAPSWGLSSGNSWQQQAAGEDALQSAESSTRSESQNPTAPPVGNAFHQPVVQRGGDLQAFRSVQQDIRNAPHAYSNSGASFQNPVSQQGAFAEFASPSEEERKLSLKPLAQISNNAYILCEGDDGLYIVCQHRAHERILADKAIAAAEGRPVESQRLVIPFTSEVGPRAAAALEENAGLLKDLGFEIEAFGGHSVLVRAVPTLVANGDYETAFADLLDEIVSGHGGRSLQERRRAMLTMLSCKNAIKAGDALQMPQMCNLLDDLLQVPNPSICPHGQPILIKISTLELDKKFEREYASR
jgi:DNA mismatch repair protein MutL